MADNKTGIYITGSKARLLFSDLATMLTGSYILVMMHTISFGEFYEMFTCWKNLQIFWSRIVAQSFPELSGCPSLDFHRKDLPISIVKDFPTCLAPLTIKGIEALNKKDC